MDVATTKAHPEASGSSARPATRGRSRAEPKSTRTRIRDFFRPSHHRGLVSLIVFLLFWQFVSSVVVKNALFLTGPVQVLKGEWHLLQAGTLQTDLRVSASEFAKGFIPSVILGVILGVAIGTSGRVKAYLDPVLNALYATPFIALAPLFILWFGIGEQKTVVLVFALVFLPVAINTDVGIRSTDTQFLDAARSFGASRVKLFTHVRLPSALPFMITGIRISVGRGLIAVVVGELFGSRAGVGYRILVSSQEFSTDQLLGGVLIFAAAGVVLVKIMERIERWAAPWRAAESGK